MNLEQPLSFPVNLRVDAHSGSGDIVRMSSHKIRRPFRGRHVLPRPAERAVDPVRSDARPSVLIASAVGTGDAADR